MRGYFIVWWALPTFDLFLPSEVMIGGQCPPYDNAKFAHHMPAMSQAGMLPRFNCAAIATLETERRLDTLNAKQGESIFCSGGFQPLDTLETPPTLMPFRDSYLFFARREANRLLRHS
jgi:hypothetical protein